MIKEIRVENYKAFKDAKIPIKPITIFLGANSAGKSSIIQLFLLLQQTAEETSESYKSALKISGRRINIGKSENLFYNKDVRKPISIELYLTSTDLESYIDMIFERVFRFINLKKNDELIKMWESPSITRKKFFIDTIQSKLKCQTNGWILLWGVEPIKGHEEELSNLIFSLYEIKRRCCKENNIMVRYEISMDQQNSLLVSQFTIGIEDVIILSFSNKNIESNIINLDNSKEKELSSSFFKEAKSIFHIFNFNTSEKKSITTETLIRIINSIIEKIREDLLEPQINHISPLRAHPQRYYMLDKADVNISLDTLDANAIAEALKDNPKLKTKVNTWFEKYDLKVNPEELFETIHRLSVKQMGLSLDITDVGFGISQVLPVVLQGFMSPEDSLTLIEQPEIHLHPKMQAELADLLIDIVKDKNCKKNLIIETHSEYLLRRLRRRMAEGEIDTKNVSINLFHSKTKEDSATIENLTIQPKGAFEWPEEFYGDELYKDITEFLKLQSNVDIHTND